MHAAVTNAEEEARSRIEIRLLCSDSVKLPDVSNSSKGRTG